MTLEYHINIKWISYDRCIILIMIDYNLEFLEMI